MHGSHTMRGLMSPIAKFVMASGAIGPMVITGPGIFGAAALFRIASITALCWGMDSFSPMKIVSAILIFGGVYLVSSAPGKMKSAEQV